MKLIELLKSDLNRASVLQGKELKEHMSFFFICKNCFSPRFMPVALYRFSHASLGSYVPFMGKFFALINFIIFGIEISPQIVIGPGLFLPHTQGTVIGAYKIGANAIIFQQVTLGARELDMGFNYNLRPLVGDNVILGAGAKILGGVTIGNGSTVGANSVVLSDVPENATFAGIPAKNVSKPV